MIYQKRFFCKNNCEKENGDFPPAIQVLRFHSPATVAARRLSIDHILNNSWYT